MATLCMYALVYSGCDLAIRHNNNNKYYYYPGSVCHSAYFQSKIGLGLK